MGHSNSSGRNDVPAWLLGKNPDPLPVKKRARKAFLTNTIQGFSRVFQNEIFCEKFVTRKGYLQMIDPRVKLVSLLLFMLFCALGQNLATLILLALVSFTFALLSELDARTYFRRVWLILPVIVLILSLPAATNLVSKGKPFLFLFRPHELRSLASFFPDGLYFTRQGAMAVLKMALRTGVSLSFAYLLIMTTRWSAITKAFAVLGIPKTFIAILSMTYRYVFLILKSASEMMEARFLRTAGNSRNKSSRNFMAGRMSFLFIRTSYLSDEIYDAMRCRGFTGRPVSLQSAKIKKIDVLWMVSTAAIFIFLCMGELVH